MAQKAAKQIARRNAQKLTQLHLISLSLHLFFIVYRLLLHRRFASASVLAKYLLFSFPSLLIQFYFEKLSRPKYAATGATGGDGNHQLRRAGEDLDAAGLMEYMWDVTYVTWACLVLVPLFGEWAWWLWAVIPLYGAYSGFTTFVGVRKGLGGSGADEDVSIGGGGGMSKRQQKLEKRGGQKIRYN